MTGHKVLITSSRHDHAEFKFLPAAVTFWIWRTYVLVDQVFNVGRSRAVQRALDNQLDYDVAGEWMNDE